jgi:hypothetical protein
MAHASLIFECLHDYGMGALRVGSFADGVVTMSCQVCMPLVERIPDDSRPITTMPTAMVLPIISTLWPRRGRGWPYRRPWPATGRR